MSERHAVWFCLGISIGAVQMWAYFALNKLIRTRAEWEKARGES